MLAFDTLEVKNEVQEPRPEVRLKTENSMIVTEAESIVIKSDADNAAAAEFLTIIKGAAKKVVEFFSDSKRKAAEAHKAICANEKAMLSPLENAETIVKRKIGTWIDAQTRLRIEAERKAAAEAAKLQAQAEKAMKKGNEEKAEELHVQAAMTAASVDYVPQKTEGVHSVKVWKWKVVDESKIPREYLVPNEKVLNAVAKSSGGVMKIPGIEFYPETSIVARAR